VGVKKSLHWRNEITQTVRVPLNAANSKPSTSILSTSTLWAKFTESIRIKWRSVCSVINCCWCWLEAMFSLSSLQNITPLLAFVAGTLMLHDYTHTHRARAHTQTHTHTHNDTWKENLPEFKTICSKTFSESVCVCARTRVCCRNRMSTFTVMHTNRDMFVVEWWGHRLITQNSCVRLSEIERREKINCVRAYVTEIARSQSPTHTLSLIVQLHQVERYEVTR